MKQKLETRDWQWAIHSQDAFNLSGVVHNFSQVISRLWNEAHERGEGTEWVNSHPICRLYAEQIYHLASGRDYFEAYQACTKEANNGKNH